MVKQTRGVRNNNPFNIKKSNQNWLGKKSINTDGTFEQFETMDYGLRAGVKLLVNYVRSGYDTPRAIISRFAPASENDLQAYLGFLEDNGVILGRSFADDVISPYSYNWFFFACFCSFVCRYESKFVCSAYVIIDIIKRYKLL